MAVQGRQRATLACVPCALFRMAYLRLWPGVRRAGLPRLSAALTPGPAPRSGAA